MRLDPDRLLSQTDSHVEAWKGARLDGEVQSWAGGARALLPELARELREERLRRETLDAGLRDSAAALELANARTAAVLAEKELISAQAQKLSAIGSAVHFYASQMNWRRSPRNPLVPSVAELDKGETALRPGCHWTNP